MRQLWATSAVCLVVLGCTGRLQARQTDDEMAIRGRLAAYAEARDRHDARAEALCYAEDGDFRGSAGAIARGRKELEQTLAVSTSDYRFSIVVEAVRMLTADVAVADAVVSAGPEGRMAKLSGLYVMVRREGQWLIGSARIAPIPVRR